MNSKNSKTSDSHKLILYLSDRKKIKKTDNYITL